MNKDSFPEIRDERTEMIENTSYKWSASLFAIAILFDINYRVWIRHDSNCWDLFAILIIAGNIPTIMQIREKVMTKSIARILLVTAILGALIAMATATVMSMLHMKP